MQKKIFKNERRIMAIFTIKKASHRLFFLLLITLICLILFSFISSILPISHGVDSLGNVYDNLGNPEVIKYLKITQILMAIGLFFFPPVILSLLSGENMLQSFYMGKKIKLKNFLVCLVLMIISLPVINLLAEWNNKMSLPAALDFLETYMRQMEDSAEQLTEAFLKMNGLTDLMINLFMMALLPALGEELLFRATLQPIIYKMTGKPILSIWITAFVFSFIHFQFFGFFPRFLIGALLGYLFYWSSNIWYPVLAHFTNNALAIVGMYLYNHKMIAFSPDEPGTGESGIWFFIITLPLIILGILAFYRIQTSQSPSLDKEIRD